MRQPRTVLLPRNLVLLAAMLAVGACGGAPESTDEPAVDVAAEPADTEAVEVETADAATTTELPDWFPEDVYLPASYAVVAAMDVGTVQRLELQATGTVTDLTEQARTTMLAQGWTEGANTGESFAFTKDDRSAMVTVNERDDGGTRVGYQFMTL